MHPRSRPHRFRWSGGFGRREQVERRCLQGHSSPSAKRNRAGIVTAATLTALMIGLTLTTAQQAIVEETRIGRLPRGDSGGYTTVRPSGVQVVNVERRGAQFVGVLNGRESGLYDEINRLTVSPDGRRLAFWARRGAQWFVVADGQEGAAYDYAPQSPMASVDNGRHLVFSPDSSRLAYSAQQGQRWLAVIDGVAGPTYSMVLPPVFSPNSRRVAYAAGEGSFRPWTLTSGGIRGRVIVDGREGAEYDELGHVEFSADSRHVAYVARKGPRYTVVLDAKEGPAFDRIEPQQRLLAPSGNRHAYIAATGGKDVMVVDGRAGPPFDRITLLHWVQHRVPTFSSDGRRLAYVAQTDGRTFVVIDGARQPAFDEVTGFVFSPNGRRFAYWARSGQSWTPLVDGKAATSATDLRPVAQNETPVFSSDGRRVGYVAWKGGTQVRTDGGICGSPEKGGSYWPGGGFEGARAVAVIDGIVGPPFTRVPTITFSPDGRRVGYLGYVSGNFASLIVDGQTVNRVPALITWGPLFSGDGRHMAYASSSDRDAAAPGLVDDSECPHNEKVAVVVDGLRGPAYDDFVVVSTPESSFQSDGMFEYIASRDGITYRVRQHPSARK